MNRDQCGTTQVTELSAVLDGSLPDTDVPNGNHIPAPMDDAEIEKIAIKQEQTRRVFDAILQKTADEWRKEKDPNVLSDALVAILDQIRGPALARVGLHAQSDTNHTTHNDDEVNGAEIKMDEYDDASDAPLDQRHNLLDDPNRLQAHSMSDRAKYIPLRLSQNERKILRLVSAALNVSEYTDVVDVLATSRMKTTQRIHAQIRNLCSILMGLAVATNYSSGQKLIKDRNFAEHQAFFQTAFEVARRHKVANPEKSRDTYGKLIHMLQDSVNKEITRLLEFSCVKPLVTVTSYLEERHGLELLEDPLIQIATMEIIPDGKSRRAVQREIQTKEHAVNMLAKKYQHGRALGEEEVRRCLYSIGDNNAYLRTARDPCDTMINYLHTYFKAERPEDSRDSIAITDGVAGARLTHDHVRQFRYVFQSLALWREICHEMYKLWYLSEKDLLNSRNSYQLRNTGQGMNRVQAAPSVLQEMNEILGAVQRRVGKWVGSSVVHLGDYNVPNALTFIDKYAQVQRILGPLSTCIRRIGEVGTDDKNIEKYILDSFGGVEPARKQILRDFFRHAFDGSGASDWFSAGSCIDGRLTSAWNWCSEIERKPYWPLFLLTGFTGFDGDF